uniref:M protein, serotype 2.1, putative n=1 Tax=Entamoeba invadens TaxID=33085 RepID=S0B494_ENTIV|nr:M protein, serotype 2.1 precursor, putative [Entamoeba invadens]
MTELEHLKEIGQKKFQDQAVWMLNAMWPKEQDKRAEELWNLIVLFSSLELENGKEGCDLDEMNMHRVFEKLNAQQTFQEMRNHMRKVGVTSFKKISMINFLIFHFGYDWKEVVEAPQGGNLEGIEKAKKMLEEVTVAFESAQKKAEESKAAAEESKKKASEATKAANEAAQKAEESKKAAEAADSRAKASAQAAEQAKKDEETSIAKEKDAEAAKAEVTKALNDVKAQEAAKEKKRADLKKKIETAGLVAKNAAIQELAKLDNEDDLPLRRAKITLEAAQKRADKAVKIATETKEKAIETAKKADEAKTAAEEAKVQADEALEVSNKAKEESEKAKQEAEEAEKQAVEAQEEAEKAVQEANDKVAEAEAYLEEQKKKAEGAGQGTIWFMQREVTEKKKFMPASKGGIAKK